MMSNNNSARRAASVARDRAIVDRETARLARAIRTTDARARDTVLTCPTPAENAAWSERMATMSGYDGGLLWQGDLAPVGDALRTVADAIARVTDSRRQRDALSQAVVALADYGNDLGKSEADEGPAGSLAFGGGLSKAATVDNSGGAQMRRWRDQTSHAIAAMQRANEEAAAKRWGKG